MFSRLIVLTNLKFPDAEAGGSVDNGTELIPGARGGRDVSDELVPTGDDESASGLDGLGGTEPPVESDGDDTVVIIPLQST